MPFTHPAISSPLQESILAIVLVVGLTWIVIAVAKYLLLARISCDVLANFPRPQPSDFARRLRNLIFKDPILFMSRLWADDRQSFVAGIWKETRLPFSLARSRG